MIATYTTTHRPCNGHGCHACDSRGWITETGHVQETDRSDREAMTVAALRCGVHTAAESRIRIDGVRLSDLLSGGAA